MCITFLKIVLQDGMDNILKKATHLKKNIYRTFSMEQNAKSLSYYL